MNYEKNLQKMVYYKYLYIYAVCLHYDVYLVHYDQYILYKS